MNDTSEVKIETPNNEKITLVFNGKEIKINSLTKEDFQKLQKYIKCINCSEYLFGARTCKQCCLTFCQKCVSKSNKCPDYDCGSESFEDSIKDAIKNKLCKVRLECEKACGDDEVTIFNYLEHINDCQGIFINCLD